MILRIALPVPMRRLFDYLPSEEVDFTKLSPGIRLIVPFRSRKVVGVLIEVAKYSSVPQNKLKNIHHILDQDPLVTPEIFNLCRFAADYYHVGLGEVLFAALPTLLRKAGTEALPLSPKVFSYRGELPLPLNSAQASAIAAITQENLFKVFLLVGVTGSGKTEVYMQAIAKVLAKGQQALVLVPEINLTPQIIERFTARFGASLAVFHSRLSPKEKLSSWQRAKNQEAHIVIGTRSAVFLPFAHLGLIVIDEEHDTSFKQQDRFRYHARDLAVIRARNLNIPIILGSATPSLESLWNAKRNRYQLLFLHDRAGNATLPNFQIVAMNNNKKDALLSEELITAMHRHLLNDSQILLFINRRGFAPVLYCIACQWIAECKRCDARLVYHASKDHLRCHHCDAQKSVPGCCEQCQGETLIPLGAGTQRVEKTLAKLFPDIPLIRVDQDNTRRKKTAEAWIKQVSQGEKAILIGTQMLAKGHHFPGVTLVGILEGDNGFLSADFRGPEQAGQLLLQVAGRAGRGEKQGEVFIQTRYGEHVLLRKIIDEGYLAFANTLLTERSEAQLPPFASLAILRAEAHQEEKVNLFLEAVKKQTLPESFSVSLLGPIKPYLTRRKGKHRAQLVIKASNRLQLQNFLKHLLNLLENDLDTSLAKWGIDVDPIEIF